MIDYDAPRFKSSEVARAARIEINSFRSYFKRGQFSMLGETEQQRQGHGYAHWFSLRDAMGFAIAGELIRLGVDASVSFKAAMWGFAHVGSVEFDPPIEGEPPAREVGQLWDARSQGFTIMVVFPGTGAVRVFPTYHQMTLEQAFSDPESRTFAPSVLLFINDIEARVYAELGIDREMAGQTLPSGRTPRG